MNMRSAILGLAILGLAMTSCKNGPESGVTLNSVSRNYSKSAEETWRAVQTVAKELDLRIDDDRHDALGGKLVALRSNKDEVLIEARSLDAQNTTVSVSVEPGDRNLAQMVQDRIQDRLGLNVGVNRTTFASGSQVDGTYDQKLEACITAAEKAIGAMKLAAPRRETHDTWARVDSQHLDSIPVQIRMDRTRKDQTFVAFTVGTGASDDNRTLALRLKAEFERHLNQEDRAGGTP
jgi:hypothetical protein